MRNAWVGLVGLAALAMPAAAQINSNEGMELVKALRENEGSKAYTIVQNNGRIS